MKLPTFLLFVAGVLLACPSNAQQYDDPVPDHDSFTIESKILGETRTINVWVPPGYKESSDPYPVMYMADGGIVNEDFPHIANTMAELIGAKEIPPMILVGIQNADRRYDLTGPTSLKRDKKLIPHYGGSENFRGFIRDELFPEINTRYRTNERKGIIGESLSGLFVMETFFLAPDMFDDYIAFDPSVWWNNHYFVRTAKEHLSKFPGQKKVLWFAGSGVKGMAKDTRAIARTLQQENMPQLRWLYPDEPVEKHNSIFRATKVKAMTRLLGGD